MQNQNSDRSITVLGVFLVIGIVFIIRLFYIQVIDEDLKLSADNNVIRHIIDYPQRGLIYDRNGELLVFNEASYDLMVIPSQVDSMDTIGFCKLIEIDTPFFREKLKKAKQYSWVKPSIFVKQISAQQYGNIQEHLYKYTGFFVQNRTLRKYPKPIASHLLGYVGEVSEGFLEKNPSYTKGDYRGVSGIEKSYENELRGQRGSKIVMVDVMNRIKGSYKNGKHDTAAVTGANLTSTIDINLQLYGEQLMQNKKGSIVVIEPATGEVLALVTSPNYDPNLLVGRKRGTNYNLLNNDKENPLFNRALMAKYPPGSTFKLLNALVALEEEVIKPHTLFECSMGYHYKGLTVGCHEHKSPLNLKQSIEQSCNGYYCNVYRRIIEKYPTSAEGLQKWNAYIKSFGLGNKLGIDLPHELSAYIPDEDYYNRYYGKKRWNSLTTISLAIGQGEISTTPLQLANQMAGIANRGYYFTPHVIQKIGDKPNTNFKEKNIIPIKKQHFEIVIDGMEDVVNKGTARIAKLDSITICGKTGTAQNPHGKDHSIFTAFAPKHQPKIAISVFVENAGYGSTWAAPIASLIIEKYLTDSVSRPQLENHILKGNLLK
jgi:penicillin-binding protein 2